MKTLTIGLCAVFLAGCTTTVPVKRNFPDAPERLMKPCTELKQIEKNDPVLSEVIKTVAENYTLYHECSMKNDAWIEWYNVQKKAFELK
jgi:PBP1b-binding outer membrane lipoprotein LpoB